MIEVGNICIELLLIFLYFSLLSEKKNNKIAIVLSYLGSVVLLSSSVFLSGNFIVNFLVTAIILALISFVNFEDNLKHRFFLIFIYLLIILLADPIVIGILYVVNVGMPEEFLQSSIGRYLGIIGTDIIYLWIISFTHRFLKKRIRDLPVRYWILIMVIPIFSIFILQFMIDSITLNAKHTNYVALGLAISGISYINITMFHFFESYENKIKLQYLERLRQQEQKTIVCLLLRINKLGNLSTTLKINFPYYMT